MIATLGDAKMDIAERVRKIESCLDFVMRAARDYWESYTAWKDEEDWRSFITLIRQADIIRSVLQGFRGAVVPDEFSLRAKKAMLTIALSNLPKRVAELSSDLLSAEPSVQKELSAKIAEYRKEYQRLRAIAL